MFENLTKEMGSLEDKVVKMMTSHIADYIEDFKDKVRSDIRVTVQALQREAMTQMLQRFTSKMNSDFQREVQRPFDRAMKDLTRHLDEIGNHHLNLISDEIKVLAERSGDNNVSLNVTIGESEEVKALKSADE